MSDFQRGNLDIGYFNSSGWKTNDPRYMGFLAAAQEREREIQKALTTGSGIVQSGDTGGRALRLQFLPGELESTTASQEDFVGIKQFPFEKAWSPVIEWSTKDSFDGGGDGWVDETGSTGAYDVDYYDDNFSRQTENIKYMAEGRQVGIVAEETRNIADPEKVSREDVELSLISKANTALYWGNSNLSGSQCNGFAAQLETWLDTNPNDYGIYYDANNQPISKYMLEDIAIKNRRRFGKINLVLTSPQAYGDSMTLVWPGQRSEEGSGGNMGGQKDVFLGPAGPMKLKFDPGLNANKPLRVRGNGANGEARYTTTSDRNSITWASNPFVASSGGNGTQALSAGSGYFWRNYTRSTDATAPAVPATPSSNGALGGNNSNHLAAGSYYYGVSVVYKGQEGPIYIYGAGTQSANLISGTPTGIAVTAGQVVQIDLDGTTPAITNLGTTYARKNVKYRVYRYGGANASAPTYVSDMQFLMEVGTPTTGNPRFWDNGMYIPGADTAFGITTMKGNKKAVAIYQLLPLMLRPLPNLPLADPIVLLWFWTPLMKTRSHHVIIYNVGRA